MARVVVLVALIVALLAAAFAAWSSEQGRPATVRQRLVAAIADHHPGATGDEIAPGWLRVNLPSGSLVDVSLARAFGRCAKPWSNCRPTIAALADDVDVVQAAMRTPRLADVEAIVVAEAASTARHGYVSRPLLGSLEARYAFVHGDALTFVTTSGANAMHATRAQLGDVALANLRKRPVPRAVAIGDGLFRIDDAGDAAANLLDATRMQAIADQVDAGPLTCGIPARGQLLVTGPDPTAQAALAARLERGKRETPNDPARAGVFPCNVAGGVGGESGSASASVNGG